jgi:hydroxyethylthiazole kinase-like uncharacterized protein yjeF
LSIGEAFSRCRDRLVYSIDQMAKADAAAIEGGIPGIRLMENAGAAVASTIMTRFAPRPAVVLCGPGNNGGDGFVVARLLAATGWPIRLGLLGERGALKGDAALSAGSWFGSVQPIDPSLLDGAGLVVDALFGAGLSRPLKGSARRIIEALKLAGIPIVAVDIPSGVHGDSGEILGDAVPARLTVTFHKAKPGHYLLPGRDHVGELVVADIGIPDSVTDALQLRLWANHPRLWLSDLPRRRSTSHKYAHGHALVVGGGPASSGAARLAARAALRAGAGAVTVLCPEAALPVYAAHLTAVMVAPFGDEAGFARLLEDARRNAVLLGPGAGVGEPLRRQVALALKDKACVLDADALTSFADRPHELFDLIKGPCLMTPHEGEFGRVFHFESDKLSRARAAAAQSGAVVLLKGADTVVAAPDGSAVIQPDAPASLATAGSGDVLAGIALGLIAHGMPTLAAGAAAVWLHADAARRFGPGLIAEDLPEVLPEVFAGLDEPDPGR